MSNSRWLFYCLPVITAVVLPGLSSGQTADDTLRVLPKPYFRDFYLLNGEGVYMDGHDTLLTGVQVTNPVMKQSFVNRYTGNFGGAVYEDRISQHHYEKFSYGLNPFRPYDLGISPGLVYDKKIFTSLRYAIGSKKEQNFLLQHRQHFGQPLAAGIDLAAGASQGFYARQLTNLRNFGIFGMYETPHNRYRAYLKFIYNKNDNQENGGLVHDTSVSGVTAADARTLQVWLNDAERIHKEKAVYFQQQLFLLRQHKTDSSGYFHRHVEADLTHAFHFYDKGMIFQTSGLDTPYFYQAYFDSAATFDSSHTRSFVNDLRLNIGLHDLPGNEGWIDADFFAGVTQQYFRLGQRQLDTLLNDLTGYTGVQVRLLDDISMRVRYDRSLHSTAEGGSRLDALLDYETYNNILVTILRYTDETRVPDLFPEINLSNHFIWFNSFGNVRTRDYAVTFGLPWLNFRLTSGFKRTDGFIYYDQTAYPRQRNGRVNDVFLQWDQDLDIRHWHLVSRIRNQQTSAPEADPLARWNLYESVYYERAFFNHALLTQIGISLRYNSAFDAPYYMPATGQFIVQHRQRYGDYTFADVFVNFQVRTAQFFFMLDHFNAGWSDKSYTLLPGYPMPGRMFRFGVEWRLFD